MDVDRVSIDYSLLMVPNVQMLSIKTQSNKCQNLRLPGQGRRSSVIESGGPGTGTPSPLKVALSLVSLPRIGARTLLRYSSFHAPPCCLPLCLLPPERQPQINRCCYPVRFQRLTAPFDNTSPFTRLGHGAPAVSLALGSNTTCYGNGQRLLPVFATRRSTGSTSTSARTNPGSWPSAHATLLSCPIDRPLPSSGAGLALEPPKRLQDTAVEHHDAQNRTFPGIQQWRRAAYNKLIKTSANNRSGQ